VCQGKMVFSNSGDAILNYLLNAGVTQSGIKYGVPRITRHGRVPMTKGWWSSQGIPMISQELRVSSSSLMRALTVLTVPSSQHTPIK